MTGRKEECWLVWGMRKYGWRVKEDGKSGAETEEKKKREKYIKKRGERESKLSFNYYLEEFHFVGFGEHDMQF